MDAAEIARLLVEWRNNPEVLELVEALEQARKERDSIQRETAKDYGACMSCFGGCYDPYGCTDCLNTGYDGGAPSGFVREDVFDNVIVERATAQAQRDAAQQSAKDASALLVEALPHVRADRNRAEARHADDMGTEYVVVQDRVARIEDFLEPKG